NPDNPVDRATLGPLVVRASRLPSPSGRDARTTRGRDRLYKAWVTRSEYRLGPALRPINRMDVVSRIPGRKASESMAHIRSGVGADSAEKLFGGWNLADDTGGGPGAVDSLLAFTGGQEPSRPLSPGPGWVRDPAGAHSTRDADLFRAFSINGEGGD